LGGVLWAEGVTNLKISAAAKKSKLRSIQAFGRRSVGGQPMGGDFSGLWQKSTSLPGWP